MEKMNKNSQPNPVEAVPVEWDVEDVAIAEAMQQITVASQAKARVRAQLHALAADEVPAFAAVSLENDDLRNDDGRNDDGSQRARVLSAPVRARLWTRRRITAASLALVASAVFLVFSLRSQPLTEQQLTQYCTDRLDLISNQVPQWKAPAADASSRLEPVLRNLNRRLTLVGSQELVGWPVADGCTVWKFDTGQGKNLYVFDFHTPRTIRDIPARFRFIQQSSTSWSLAALQHGDRLLVVAIEGDIADYIKSLEWA